MGFARLLAKRSTCARDAVGCVVTDAAMLQVLGLGYNGNARGLPNCCDSDAPGACGCLHAELNALLKAPGALPGKILFTTRAPCPTCAKMIVNAGIALVWYLDEYRDAAGLGILRSAGVAARRMALWEPS